MAALLGVDLPVVEEICREAAQGEVVEVANITPPAQIVVAGHKGAVERTVALAASRGGKRSVLLPVGAPFHCRLMAPAAGRRAPVGAGRGQGGRPGGRWCGTWTPGSPRARRRSCRSSSGRSRRPSGGPTASAGWPRRGRRR